MLEVLPSEGPPRKERMQMQTRVNSRALLGTALLVGLLALAAAPTSRAQEVALEANVPVPMSDGITLSADLYRPDEEGPFPVVLVRTPYDKGAFDWLGQVLAGNGGYAVLIQDVRGQVTSEGDFEPFVDEFGDGMDTLDWVAAQSWCDGNVGMWGSSYLSYCALVLAPSGHPALKAIFCISGWGDPEKMGAPGGAMHLMLALPWTLSPQVSERDEPVDFEDLFGLVPVSRIPDLAGIESPEWSSYFVEGEEGLGDAPSTAGRYGEINIPIIYVTGWHDFLAETTLDVYEGVMEAHSGAEPPPFQKLVVGPWHHDQQWTESSVVGDYDFGPDGAMGSERILGLTIRWFHRFLRGIETGVEHEPPARIFVMGQNEWRGFDDWPPNGVATETWSLDSGGSANTLEGDGVLGRSGATGSDSDSYTYDPTNPVPTMGGANMHFFPERLGIRDQRPIESREDVLVYTSEPLESDLDIIGPVSAMICGATEGQSADFTAKLVTVRPDGYARIVTEGIKRNPDTPEDGDAAMIPGKVYRFTIDMASTAIRVPAGDRLRLEVSSSNFPKYTRNPSTSEEAELAEEFVAVTQTVYHTSEYPSHVALPVLR
jgi:predicted acyl esterase